MSDEREYWRSAVVGRVNEQQPIYAGELLDELVDLRAQLAERDRRIGELEAERKLLIEDFRDRCERVIEVRTERDNWQETARQAYRNVDYYRGLVVSIGELFGLAAMTSDDGSIQDDVLCAKVPELCTAMSGERDQLAAEAARLREALSHWKCERCHGTKIQTDVAYRVGPCEECESSGVHPIAHAALAATPHAAKAAERVKVRESVVEAARMVMQRLPIPEWTLNPYIEDLRDALDRLDALDKPEVQEWKCPNPNCIDGAEDTGGVTPWDEPILIPCPACQDRKREKA